MLCGVIVAVTAVAAAGPAAALDGLPALPTPTAPIPTLPTPTAPIPTLPTPTVPTPKVPTPTVPTPPAPSPPAPTPPAPAPTLPAPKSPTPAPPAPVPPVATPPAPGAPAPVPQPPTTQASPNAAPATASVPKAVHASVGSTRRGRSTSARARAARPVVARFSVRRTTRLRVSVSELAPLCRSRAAYRVAARPGANVLRAPRRLGPGTYRLVGRTRAGREVFDIATRLVPHGSRLEAHRAPSSSVCQAPQTTFAAEHGTAAKAAPSKPSQALRPQVLAASERHVSSGTSPLIRAVSLRDAPAPIRPLLYVLLAISIGLLAVAGTPQQALPAGAAAVFVARRRGYLATAGICLLVAVAALTALA